MVAVLVMTLVMAGLGAAMLTGARGARRKTRKVSQIFQRSLVLDAAMVHGFHTLRKQKVDLTAPLVKLKTSAGQGKLADIPYRFQLVPDPETKTVRIQVEAGEKKKKVKGFAVAYLRIEDQGERTQLTWSIRYFGPKKAEAGD
jgi:hypothetical protein